MSSWDLLANLTQGGQAALKSYMDTSEKKKDRDSQLGLLRATKGLVPKKDESGNIISGEFEENLDPAFAARARKEKLEAAQLGAIDQGINIIEDEQGNIKYGGRDPKRMEEDLKLAQLKNEQDPYGLKTMAATEAKRNADQRIQDISTEYGEAKTPEDAKEIKAASDSKNKFDRMLTEMIEIRKRNPGGSVANLKDIRRGQQLAKKALLEMKNMAKLGVLSKSDEDIVDAIIPNPTGIADLSILGKGDDTVLQRLEALKNDTSEDFKSTLGTRLRSPEKSIQKNEGLIAPPSGLMKTGLIKPEEKKAEVPPKPGTVVDGYSFKGGDPSKPENWELSKKAGM